MQNTTYTWRRFPFARRFCPSASGCAVVRVGCFVGRSFIVMLRRRSFLAAPFRGFNAEHHVNVAAFSFCPPLLPVGKRVCRRPRRTFRRQELYSNAPQAELPCGSFSGIQCRTPRIRGCVFLLPVGKRMRRRPRRTFRRQEPYSNAPQAELPCGSFSGIQCRTPRKRGCVFLLPAAFARRQAAGKRKTLPLPRKCSALAGAIGIEPTPWESEAHVLPLHQAPTRK